MKFSYWLRIPVSIPACLALLVLFSAAIAWPQNSEPGASAQQADQQPSSAQKERNEPKSLEGRLGEESREAAGEEKDEAEQFKRSSSVTLVARITGLSLRHAYWLCLLGNFGIIAGVLVWVWRSKLPSVFSCRTQAIQKALEEARKASEDAGRRLAEIEGRLKHLDGELREMRANAEKEAAAEEARISAAAEEETRKIVISAEQEIAAAAKSVRRDLKAYVADLAISLASRQIRVNSATDQALVERFGDQLNAEKNGAGKDGH
jgi:F-type H+-transporting ATPase subunit b